MREKISISTLTFSNKIVGYRLLVMDDSNNAKYYDINVSVAEKYGLAKGMTGVEVPLINYDGLLLSRQEKEHNVTVEDISNNTSFLKKISSLKTNKRSNVDIKAKLECDKRKAMQMDRFNKILNVCLNLITKAPYVKKIGNYSVIPINLENEIDAILVSQGVFTVNKSLCKRVKEELIKHMKKNDYVYVNTYEYSKTDRKNTMLNTIISKYDTQDLLLKGLN